MPDDESLRLELYRATHEIGKLKASVGVLWAIVLLLIAAFIFGR